MHRYTTAQARGLRTASPNLEQQPRAPLRDRLNQSTSFVNTFEGQETSGAYLPAHMAHAWPNSRRSPSVFVTKYGSPTTIPALPHRQISSNASSWTQALNGPSASQSQPGLNTSAPQHNRSFTVTAPANTAAVTRSTSGNQAVATAPVAITPYTAPSWRPGANQSSSGNSPPSVKHLTCYFWDKYGKCKWSDAECLYAHFHTGKVAGGPVQVEIGRPAVAGKNASAPKPVYESWRNHPAPNTTHSTSPVSPLSLAQPSHDFATHPNAPFHTPRTNNHTQSQNYPTLGTSPQTANHLSSGSSHTQHPIGTPRINPVTPANRTANTTLAAENVYYQQLSALYNAVSLLDACLASSNDSMHSHKSTLTHEATVLVKLAKEMQARETGAFGRTGTWDAGAFGGSGPWAFADAGAAAALRGGSFGWLGRAEEVGAGKRVLQAVQKLCDVIAAQATVLRGVREVRGRVQGILGELGLDGLGEAEAEVEAGEVWDSE